jgi:fatty acid-binding protein DegV
MRDYIVISDSTADLPISVVKELEVPIVPFSYSIEEQVYEYYLDERDGDIGNFYERLRKGAMPVTSQINPVMYQDFFEPYVKSVFINSIIPRKKRQDVFRILSFPIF